MKTENELIILAQWDICDKIANAAMNELRTNFDKTYGWCDDCDGLVCKEKECCLNQDIGSSNEIDF
tara:strand:+ start:392 stop:589 length:198 start_codon:yes stop_codon:yes gene_type:complete